VSDEPRYIGWLDGWRGAAVACVLVSHFGGPYFLGRFGVNAFFVLSGLLISRMLYDAGQVLPEFFWRRAARVLPALLVYLILIHLLAASVGWVVPSRELLAQLLFIRSYWPDVLSPWNDGSLPFVHLWSLNVEEHAYVCMAVIAWIVRRNSRAAAVVLAACTLMCVSFVYYYRYSTEASILPFTVRTECAALPIFLSATLSLCMVRMRLQVSRWIAPVAIALATACASTGIAKMSLYMVVVPALLAVSLNALAASEVPSSFLHRVFAKSRLQQLGRCSFSVYLWQQPLHTLYQRGHLPGPGALWLVLSVALGIAMYNLIERPARRWLVARSPVRSITYQR
jgi:peptidoglycan/LPS O-acetylase OafA/YrhL